MNGQRVLTALVFTDAVAFSTRVGQNEERALQEMQADFELMREVATAHEGRVLKSMGDGLLMVFDSASQAVDAALEIQRRFGERPPEALKHRMGVHLCDVVMEENDAHGDGVNLAARLEAEASPGGICLSQTIYDIVKSRLPVQAKFLGERHLKNLVEPVNVFEIAPSNAPRGQRIPPKGPARPRGNYAVAGALVFLGMCILAFAAVQASKGPSETPGLFVFKSPRPPQKEAMVTENATPERKPVPASPKASTSKVRPQLTAPPKPTITPTPSTPKAPPPSATPPDASVPPPIVEEGKDASPRNVVLAPVSLETIPGYRRAAQRFARNNDFRGMRAWLEAEEQEALRKSPDYEATLTKWDRMESLMVRIESDLIDRDVDEALKVAFPLSRGIAPTQVWSSDDGKIEVRTRNGNTRTFEFRKLDPMAIRALAMASARERGDLKEVRSLLATFDQEFGARYGESFRRIVRPGTGRGVSPPNVSTSDAPEIRGGTERADAEKGRSTTTG